MAADGDVTRGLSCEGVEVAVEGRRAALYLADHSLPSYEAFLRSASADEHALSPWPFFASAADDSALLEPFCEALGLQARSKREILDDPDVHLQRVAGPESLSGRHLLRDFIQGQGFELR